MKKAFYILMFFGFVLPILGQTDTLTLKSEESFYVDSIRIVGNDKTEDFIILRELSFAENDTINSEILNFSKQRLFSLKLFYFVELYPIVTPENNILEIFVKETWYIFPLPILRIQDNDISKSNYGAMLVYNNFRGRNETITAFASLGYDPSYGIGFSSPVFIQEENISFSCSIVYQTINNKSLEAEIEYGTSFKYDNILASFSVGKRLNLNNEIFGRIGYQYLEAPTGNYNITASGTGIDRIPYLGIQYVYDSRNLKQFADEGRFAGMVFDHKGFGLNSILYNVLILDYREYRKITNKFATKWRVASRNTFGKNVPYYDYSYLGFSQYVRGYKTGEREGHNSLLGSLEFNYPIIKDWDFSIDLLFLPTNLTSARISIFLTAFAETGITYDNGDKIEWNNFDSGYGGGITFVILPRNAFRLEYAVNDLGKGEFILGTKLSF